MGNYFFHALAAIAVVCGVLLSFTILFQKSENPSRIPFRYLLKRYKGTIFSLFAAWVILSYFTFLLISSTPGLQPPFQSVYFFIASAAVIGIIFPHISKLKGLLNNRFFRGSFHYVFIFMHWFDEYSAALFDRIIYEEERRISHEIMRKRGLFGNAIDIYFEESRDLIFDALSDKFPGNPINRARGIKYARNRHVKLKFLLRHHGVVECEDRLGELVRGEWVPFKNWSVRRPDIRKKPNRRTRNLNFEGVDRRIRPQGKRRDDSP